MKTMFVTLKLTYDDSKYPTPDCWDWQNSIDMGPDETVSVVQCEDSQSPAPLADAMLGTPGVDGMLIDTIKRVISQPEGNAYVQVATIAAMERIGLGYAWGKYGKRILAICEERMKKGGDSK